MVKRGQAALEFLTTYGWAFLVILVMIGGLSYFGVLDISQFVPETCKLDSKLECGESFLVQSGGAGGDHVVAIQMHNNLQKAVVVSGIRIWERDVDRTSACVQTLATPKKIDSRRTEDVTFDPVDGTNDCGIVGYEGKKRSFNVEINYLVDGTTIPSIATGSLTATIRQP